MRIAKVRATNFESSAWGDFYEREAELPLVTAIAIYPEYRHPISTWRPTEAMCIVEVETDDGAHRHRLVRRLLESDQPYCQRALVAFSGRDGPARDHQALGP